MITQTQAQFKDRTQQKTTQGTLEIESWSAQERMRRALKYGGMTFGLAVAFVFIPIVHFVMVPLLLLATPFVAYYFYNQKEIVKDGKGPCPECGKELTVAKSPSKFPLDDVCNHCRKPITITV